MSSVETAPKDRGTLLAEERTDLALLAHGDRGGKNADGMDPNCPFDDRIRFQHLQILPISCPKKLPPVIFGVRRRRAIWD